MNKLFLDYMSKEDLKEYPQLNELSDVIGVEIVKKLIREFPSSEIYIPAIKSFKKVYRRYLLETYTIQGKLESIHRIAQKERCTRGYIRLCLQTE